VKLVTVLLRNWRRTTTQELHAAVERATSALPCQSRRRKTRKRAEENNGKNKMNSNTNKKNRKNKKKNDSQE